MHPRLAHSRSARARLRDRPDASAAAAVPPKRRNDSASPPKLRTVRMAPSVRGLHSSTFRLNLSTFRGIHWVVSLTLTNQVEVRSGGVEAPAQGRRRGGGHGALRRRVRLKQPPRGPIERRSADPKQHNGTPQDGRQFGRDHPQHQQRPAARAWQIMLATSSNAF